MSYILCHSVTYGISLLIALALLCNFCSLLIISHLTELIIYEFSLDCGTKFADLWVSSCSLARW